MREKLPSSDTFSGPATSKSSTTDGAFEQGQIVGGKYKIISLLGSGGMGSVYRVLQVFLNKEFALKTLDVRKTSDMSARRFQLEAKAASLLDHPNLVQVHDFGLLKNGLPYLVMDYIDGVSLSQYLLEQGPLAAEKAIPLFAQVCFGLSYAHDKGVIHRDIKPSNLMLVKGTTLGDEGSIKVVDFGIAKLTSHEDGEVQALTRTGEIFGSPLYMSPEQCSGAAVDRRTDVYSLGCVLFEALTGAPPHLGQTALKTMMLHQTEHALPLKQASLGKEFPDKLERIIRKMLAKTPGERYDNLGVVAHELAFASNNTTGNRSSAGARPKQKKAPKTITIQANNLYLLLASTIFVTAVASVLIGKELDHHQGRLSSTGPTISAPQAAAVSATIGNKASNEPGKGQGPEQTQSELVDAKLSLEKDDVKTAESLKMLAATESIPATKIQLPDGQEGIQYAFPQCGIGTIGVLGNTRWFKFHKLHEAKGIVTVPANESLVLNVEGASYPATFAVPSIFSKIGKTDFVGIQLKDNGIANAAESDAVRSSSLMQILQTIRSWERLKSVSITSAFITARDLSFFNDLPALQELNLASAQLDGKVLAQQPFLKRLKKVSLGGLTNIDGVIDQLGRSNNLVCLTLRNNSMTPSILAKLSGCKRLVYLVLRQKPVDDQTIEAITKLKALQIVGFEAASLSPAQLAILSSCPNIEQICLQKEKVANADALKLKYSKVIWSSVDSESGLKGLFFAH